MGQLSPFRRFGRFEEVGVVDGAGLTVADRHNRPLVSGCSPKSRQPWFESRKSPVYLFVTCYVFRHDPHY